MPDPARSKSVGAHWLRGGAAAVRGSGASLKRRSPRREGRRCKGFAFEWYMDVPRPRVGAGCETTRRTKSPCSGGPRPKPRLSPGTTISDGSARSEAPALALQRRTHASSVGRRSKKGARHHVAPLEIPLRWERVSERALRLDLHVGTFPVKESSAAGEIRRLCVAGPVPHWRRSRSAGGAVQPGVARQGLMSSPPRRV